MLLTRMTVRISEAVRVLKAGKAVAGVMSSVERILYLNGNENKEIYPEG